MTTKLILRARHFEGANYVDNKDCPVARAANEQFSQKDAYVTPSNLRVGPHWFGLNYDPHHYFEDKKLITPSTGPNEIIRELDLKGY